MCGLRGYVDGGEASGFSVLTVLRNKLDEDALVKSLRQSSGREVRLC
jgi:hypothetical protein